MNHLLYRFVIVAALFITSCASNQPQQETKKTTESDSVIQQYVKDIEASDTATSSTYDGFTPKKIDSNSLGGIKVIRKKAFDPDVAMRQLFPGAFVHVADPAKDNDSVLVSVWVCKTCHSDRLSGWYGEDTVSVPYEEGNITRAGDTLQFADEQGKQHIIISFSTVRLQDPEMMFSGRFICAVLGLAEYVNEHDQWVLNSFAPQLGCYGAFQSLPDLHRAKLGRNNFGCSFLNTNGGAGGPFYSDLYVYGLVNNKFTLLLNTAYVKRSRFGFNGWDEQLEYTNTDGYGAITLTMNGGFDRKEFDEEQDNDTNVPVEVQQTVKTNNHFSYKIVRQYIFTENRYTIIDSKVEIK